MVAAAFVEFTGSGKDKVCCKDGRGGDGDVCGEFVLFIVVF